MHTDTLLHADDPHAAARALLRRAGLKPTLHRVLVLATLKQSDQPLSAREVLERLADDAVNRVTVYRILDLFTDKGVAKRISSHGRGHRYCARQGLTPGHGHFHCLVCGEVQCLDPDTLPFDAEALGALSMEIHAIDLRLDGVCAACRDKA